MNQKYKKEELSTLNSEEIWGFEKQKEKVRANESLTLNLPGIRWRWAQNWRGVSSGTV